MMLDTSGLFFLHNQARPQHSAAVAYFHAAPVLLTHSYVLAEFVALADARSLPRLPALEFVRDLQDNPDVDVVYVDQALHTDALHLLRNRLDKARPLCDAVSFLLMQDRGILEALTTDHHFEQAGFVRLLTP